uniref:Uncharacterized protein n=1 Tax=Arundo donax TaxID=35708 RepID=A0A0A9BMQ2_ARUDO
MLFFWKQTSSSALGSMENAAIPSEESASFHRYLSILMHDILGIDHVLNSSSETKHNYSNTHGLNHIRVPMHE